MAGIAELIGVLELSTLYRWGNYHLRFWPTLFYESLSILKVIWGYFYSMSIIEVMVRQTKLESLYTALNSFILQQAFFQRLQIWPQSFIYFCNHIFWIVILCRVYLFMLSILMELWLALNKWNRVVLSLGLRRLFPFPLLPLESCKAALWTNLSLPLAWWERDQVTQSFWCMWSGHLRPVTV